MKAIDHVAYFLIGTIACIIGNLNGRNVMREKMEKEAIQHGAGEYVIGYDLEPEFKWKENK